MKTQNTKLQFGKSSITELNDSQSLGVNGGCQWSESSGQTIKISIKNPNDNNYIIKR
ncbi:class I lanthipeptide [Lacinutrix sp.]|uniref:class I lanthipeptide n=1 Tax=Lacinutrix sp. TaxID=1937692 RepID=UPI0025BFA229|nr:class I lanthipeptide [Lacinutrix sp.]